MKPRLDRRGFESKCWVSDCALGDFAQAQYQFLGHLLARHPLPLKSKTLYIPFVLEFGT